MKHRKILSALLALVMVMALAVPALAAEHSEHPPVTLSANVEDEDKDLLLEKKTYDLRNWVEIELNNDWDSNEGDIWDGGYSTQKSETLYSFSPDHVYALPLGVTLTLTGPSSQAVEGHIYLRAWSDPEGDGIYEQRIVSDTYIMEHSTYEYFYEDPARRLPIPVQEQGPLKGGFTYCEYSNAVAWTISYPDEELLTPSNDMLPGLEYLEPDTSWELSGAMLTELFGPETLIELEIQGSETSTVYYHFYLTGKEELPGAAQPTESAEPEKPAVTVPEGAITYTARKGDTWGQLALNNYGTYGVWKQLMAANKGVSLKEGAAIVLPATLGKTVRLAAQVLAEGETFYTVKAGDTLGQIAANTYKDINMYKSIFERNSDRLTSANMIYEGQVLVLPVKSAQ